MGDLRGPAVGVRWIDSDSYATGYAAYESGDPAALERQLSDDFAPVPLAERLAGRIPNATLTVIHGAGHLLVDEQPQRL